MKIDGGREEKWRFEKMKMGIREDE